jgi:hypothetical protein
MANAISNQFWSRKKRTWCAFVFALLVLVGCCLFLRISRPADVMAYVAMVRGECHPVWKEFSLRRLNVGDSAAEFLRRIPPSTRDEFGRYGLYRYYRNSEGIPFDVVSVVTRDGRLWSAESGSCTWQFTFFRDDDPQFGADYTAYLKEKTARRERERVGATREK